jgi:hypothetical protein
MGNVDDDTPAVTQLDDARVLKKLGAPLTMAIERREFSQEYSERWFALMNAHTRFMIAVREYSDGPRAGSPGKWRLVRRRLVAVRKEMFNCDAFVGRLMSGIVTPGTEPVFESEQEQREYFVLSHFITERAMPFLAYWEDSIDTVSAGTGLMIRPGDIPAWLDDDPLADPVTR